MNKVMEELNCAKIRSIKSKVIAMLEERQSLERNEMSMSCFLDKRDIRYIIALLLMGGPV
jgi:hypothetical protein